MTLVIVSAEIDLSVASVLALSGMVAALAMEHVANSWLIGAAAALLVGGLVGFINGTLSTRLAVPSFLVTLGMLGIARGIALVLTDTEPVIITNQTYYTVFGEGYYFGIPAPIAWTIIVAAVGIVLLHFTTFGQKIYAVGGNSTAARYSGINTARVRTIAFVITGVLAGLAALVLSARAHAARPDVAQGLELDVITAVILGGTRLFGGFGTIVGTILGSVLIGILNNGLVLVNVSSSWQLAIKGAIIIAAVAFGRK
jgi:ribose transport system permease protein